MKSQSRRSFLKKSLIGGTGLVALPTILPRSVFAAGGAGEKVKLACIGIGNRGADVVKALHETGLAQIVAFCDTDMGAPHTTKTLEKFPDVPRFQDFRKMFDKMGKDIEAVSIAIPDFAHF